MPAAGEVVPPMDCRMVTVAWFWARALPAYITEAASNISDDSSTKPTYLVFAIKSSLHQKDELSILYYVGTNPQSP